MIGRRGFLGAAAGALAWGSSAARGGPPQASKDARKAKASKPKDAPVEADEQTDRVLAPVRDAHRLPGLIGAIVRGDAVAAIGAVGVRKIGSDAPITAADRVHLGSCTKALTATLIGTVVDEGKLRWDSTLAEVFPGHAKVMHPGFRRATLAHLLTHRAGLPHDGPWWELGRNRTTTDQRRELIPRMLRTAPESTPGETYAYSNVGYALAGLMAEQATGRPWERLIRDRLFTPLGMASAGFGPPGSSGRVEEPWGHREVDGRTEATREDNAPALGPAGTVHVSLPDWAKFASLHLRAGQGKPRLLKAETFRALQTPAPGSDYCGGWYSVERSKFGGRALTHEGSNLSWYAGVWVAPASDLAVLVAVNKGGDDAGVACKEAADALLRLDAYRHPGGKTRRR